MLRVKGELNGRLRNTWQADLCSAPCTHPCRFCCGAWCPCLYARQQRHKILDITGEPYVCCGGGCVCCNTAWQEREPWLTCEACCCTTQSILANRFLIQTRFSVQNDGCDESIIGIVACLNVLIELASCFVDRETAEHLQHLEHCVNCTVCSCFLAQQGVELKHVQDQLQQQPYQGPPTEIFECLPPAQQQMVQAAQALHQPPPQQQAPGGLVAQGREVLLRQVMVTVPPGVGPGQMVPFSTPDGAQMQAQVPPGVGPGQQFPVNY